MVNTKLRIKELCKKCGMTQAQLAHMLGIQAVSFSQAVSRNKFSIDRLAEIAEALNVEIPDLFENRRAKGEDEAVITCPNCGERIAVRLRPGERGEEE